MNNFMTLSLLANFPGAPAKMENGHRVKNARRSPPAAALIAEEKAVDEQARRFQRLQHDWRVLASEWLALTGALEQFEQEFEQLEKDLMCRWKRRASDNGMGERLNSPEIHALTEPATHAKTMPINKHNQP